MAPNRPWRFGQRRAIRVAKESNSLLDRERRQEPSKGNRLRNSALGGVVGRAIMLSGFGVNPLWVSGDQACMALLGDRPMHRMLLVAAAFAFGAAVIQSGDADAQAGKNKAPPRSSGGAAGGIVSEGQGYGVFISTQR